MSEAQKPEADYGPRQAELERLNAKIARGEPLNNGERCMRQGIIFNHIGIPLGGVANFQK